MELVSVNPVVHQEEVQQISNRQFIEANTESVEFSELRDKNIIPVFAKDNHATLSYQDFIETVWQVAEYVFNGEKILQPSIRVSHPIKGRIPEAKHKAAIELLENEKTLYYERMAFVIEIPGINDTVSDNKLSLTVGGVRSYNIENLYSKKSMERFKVFIGFKNSVCCNLCISTDGFKSEILAGDIKELAQETMSLFGNFRAIKLIHHLNSFNQHVLTESQFAQMIGKSRLYNYLPSSEKKKMQQFPLNDSQVSAIARDYYNNKSFSRTENGDINLWNLYNLFTSAGKSSYIDTFLDRNINSYKFLNDLRINLNSPNNWYLN